MTRAERMKRLKAVRKWIAEERDELLRSSCLIGPGNQPLLSTMDKTFRPYLRRADRALRAVDELILAEMSTGSKPRRPVNKIIRGLNDAIAFTRGDRSRARVVKVRARTDELTTSG